MLIIEYSTVALVLLKQVSKVYERPGGQTVHAVRELSLAIEDKELLVLLGPSGCGKTTILRLIAGLEKPTSGTIEIDGTDATNRPPQERNVAMVFQNGALYPHMTAYENMAFGLKVRRVAPEEIRSRVTETAELLGLTTMLTCRPERLSGGQRQRVALGRAMVRRPRILLLDEPLSNLDSLLRTQLREEILKLRAASGCSILHVTHDQAEAFQLGQRVALLDQGRLQQIGSPEEIRQRPANEFVSRFLG
jgi:multiple sugar transport system ATP-binding protein